MTCEVRAFEPEHFEALTLNGIFNSKDEIRTRIASIRHRSGCYLKSIFLDKKPVAIVGLIQTWGGVAEVWSVASEDVRMAPVTYTRTVKRMLEDYSNRLKLHRVQMTVKRDYHEGHHWAVVLGFRNEGILREYGPDRADYLMFARVA